MAINGYNVISKTMWELDELMFIYVEEEGRLKRVRGQSANLVHHRGHVYIYIAYNNNTKYKVLPDIRHLKPLKMAMYLLNMLPNSSMAYELEVNQL